MFSGLRNVVEGFAQPPRRASQDVTSNDRNESVSRSPSLDSNALRESSSIAENLRKSLAVQRTGSPLTPPEGGPSVSAASVERKRRLEDRLRASFAIGDASSTTTPATSPRASPAPVSVTDHPLSPSPVSVADHPLSPTSIPLPTSPPVDAHEPQIASLHTLSLSPPLLSLKSPVHDPADAATSSTPEDQRHSEADVPLPQSPSHEHTLPPIEETQSEQHTVDNVDPQRREEGAEQVTVIALPLAEESEVKHEENDEAVEAPGETPPEESADVPAENPVPETSEPEIVSVIAATTAVADHDIEALRERLRLVEQRFSDVSTSFKRLQAEKLTADKVLQDLTPIQGWQDVGGIQEYLQSVQLKAEIAQDEVKRLTGKLTRQDERIEELRETHRLESRSQSDLIDQLRKQLEESKALVNTGISSSMQQEADLIRHKSDIEKAHAEVERAKLAAKDEEEKRTKAMSLLKTMRQKVVKVEKERDDVLKEIATLKEREKTEREKDKAERATLQAELDKVKSEKEAVVSSVKAQSERDVAGLKERSDKELSALRAQVELDAITSKSLHDQTLAVKNARINDLELSIQTLSAEKDSLFDQLQLRQAEVESSQSLLEVLQSQTTELQYQVRESADRIALLNEELADAKQDQQPKLRDPSTSAEEVARLISAAEARYETKLSETRRKLASVEAERTEVEAEWSRKLDEKVREAEKWKRVVDSSVQDQQHSDSAVNDLKQEVERLKHEARSHHLQVSQLQLEIQRLAESEDTAKLQRADFAAKIAAYEKQLEEAKSRESQARAQNKTIREELRKVQSSAALLERQRNPGVGYWSSPRPDGATDTLSPTSQSSSVPSSRVASPSPGSIGPPANDEEVNLEYLRNVILQFLEHKEMRPNLVRVLSIILHFTPQETRRLIAKV